MHRMRRSLVVTLLVLALSATSACQQGDPNAFETHTVKLKDEGSRSTAMADLQRLVKAVAASDNQARRDEFAAKVLPEFIALYPEAGEFRLQMLEMARDIARVEALPLWQQALEGIDGTTEATKAAFLALQGIRTAKLKEATPDIIKALDGLIANPQKDEGEETGKVRLELIKTLGVIPDPKAVDSLLKVLEVSLEKQPIAVHREAIKTLGLIGDTRAIDALLIAPLRLPDEFSTTNIFERSAVALAGIGDPAVEPALKMFKGENAAVAKLAAEASLPDSAIKTVSAQLLGALGSPKAAPELIAYMGALSEECAVPRDPAAEVDAEKAGLRQILARQLGFLGDPTAVPVLCTCATWSGNPADMQEISQSLGWIGGAEATTCLLGVIANGQYDEAIVANPDFKFEVRWEGVRHAILAAPAADIGKVKEAMTAAMAEPKVKAQIEKLGWAKGIEIVETCKEDRDCYLKTLQDATAPWIAREKSALMLARMEGGDKKALALEISRAFKVRSPVARVTMATLVPRVLGGEKCPECAEALNAVMESEKGSVTPEYQLSFIKARHTMARVADLGKLEAEGEAKAAAQGG
jgi:HEAT repeat protein